MNKYLEKAKKVLANSYFIEEKDENILSLSPSDQSQPFAYLLYQDSNPNTIIISFAVDFPHAAEAAELVLTLIHICKVAIGESFYCDKGMSLHWGNEAYDQFELQEIINLDDLEPVSELKN